MPITPKTTMLQREQLIQKLMAEGVERNTMLKIVAREFKVSERSIRKQYELIVSDIQKMFKEQRGELRANLMARQEGIFQECIKKGNLKTALEATRDQAKLAGLFETEAEEVKRPDAIIFKEKDFSTPLAVVPSKVAGDE